MAPEMALADSIDALAATEPDSGRAGLLECAASQIRRLHTAVTTTEHVVCEILGGHMYGYADCEGTPLPCWGDHTAESLAVEAVNRLAALETPPAMTVNDIEPFVAGMFNALAHGDMDDATEIVAQLAMRRPNMTPAAAKFADLAENVHRACINGADLATL